MQPSEFYYIDDNRTTQGPVPFGHRTSLPLKPDTYVWFEGLGQKWLPAAQVPEFAAMFSRPTPPPQPDFEATMGINDYTSVIPQVEQTRIITPDSASEATEMLGTPSAGTPPIPAQGHQRVTLSTPGDKPGHPARKPAAAGMKPGAFIGICFGALLLLSLISMPLSTIIAATFSTAPLYISIGFGAIVLAAAIFIAIAIKRKPLTLITIIAGVLTAGAMIGIEAARFDDRSYRDGILIRWNKAYNSFGGKILDHYGIYGIRRASGSGDNSDVRMITVNEDYNYGDSGPNSVVVKGYDMSGHEVFHETYYYNGSFKFSDLESTLASEENIYIQ